MSNNNYAASAQRAVSAAASTLVDYLADLDVDSRSVSDYDEIEDIRYVINTATSELAYATARLDALRYDTIPGELRRCDPWVVPVTRRALRSPRRAWWRR